MNEIGAGYQNSLNISNQCETEGDGITAAQAALDYESGGYDDWYLPSQDQWELMYNSISYGDWGANIAGFTSNDYYWTSTEAGHLTAIGYWNEAFDPWPQNHSLKSALSRVRAIRSF